MEHVFIIAERSDLIESLMRFFCFSRGLEAQVYLRSESSIEEQQWVPQTFHRIAGWMERIAIQSGSESSLRKSLAIIELFDKDIEHLAELSPITSGRQGWAAVVAMLILAFPEVHWVLITPHRPIDSFLFEEAHLLGAGNSLSCILKLHDSGFMALFDPTGFRNAIRERLRTTKGVKPDIYISARQRTAAAVDEEEAYACFNAYTAFRFGFSAHTVTSYAMMKRVFGPDSDLHPRSRPTLVFEDLYLRFPDKDDEEPLSDLERRDELFPWFTSVKYRIFVTVGHRRAAYAERWRQSQSHLEHLRASMWTEMLYKPFSGMFDLWHRSGLKRKLKEEGFAWPRDDSASGTIQGGHSAPGRLLIVAEQLIGRANAVLHSAGSVPDAVHGAALALNAQELLGNRTPTTTLEALALKHQLEVVAECMFYGVEYNMDVERRFDEIKRDVKSVQEWFHPDTRRLSAFNAQIRIVSELILKFREHNQFDEEQQCLSKVRELHRHLWFSKHASWAWLVYPVRWYVDFLLSSVLRFVFAILFWIVLFSFLFALFPHNGAPIEISAATHAVSDSVSSFFGLQLAHDLNALKEEPLVLINMFIILTGFLHLGILISHLYSIVTRR